MFIIHFKSKWKVTKHLIADIKNILEGDTVRCSQDSFSFTCVQSLHYFTTSMLYFYDAKTYPKCFVFNMYGVLTKFF